MNSAHHALFVVNGPRNEVHQQVCEWIGNSKFQLETRANPARILATYPGWHGFGITDGQTATVLEILLADAEGKTAVSIYHHTRRIFILTGAMFGNILEREVDSLIMSLRERDSVA